MRELGDSEKIFHPARGDGGMWGRGVLEGDVVHAKVCGSLLGQSPRHLSGTWFQASLRQGQLITSLNCLAAPPQGWVHTGTLPELKFEYG